MKTTLKIATARINHVGTEDELVLNTTFKSGVGLGATFAPLKQMVMNSKYRGLAWEEYTAQFYQLMRQRYAENQAAFEQVLNSNKTVVFTCYCNNCYENQHCHRYLLVDIFRKLADSRNIEFEYLGELKKANGSRSTRK